MTENLLKSFQSWWRDDPFTDSAAIAYYAIFSIPGLLAIILAGSALFYEADIVEGQVFNNVEQLLGGDVANNLMDIVAETSTNGRDIWAVIIGTGALLFGATGLFVQLQRSLNSIWGVPEKKKKRLTPKFIKDRLLSFSMIVVIGFLLLISLMVTAVLGAFSAWISSYLSTSFLFILTGVDFVVSLLLVSTLFTLIFKVLPDRKVAWIPAFKGGVLSAIFFQIGEYGLNLYFNIAQPASTFGAAGSVILLMIWVFYSAMILLIGAEYSKQVTQELHIKKAKEKAG